ncbi:GTP cyclohydrolase I FolE [Campylobacter hyointestinalis]|uniref:GTP cyclohydrolase 1 n=1 Tax=Campylobacter hyointestinalis subsp. hyointestinalis TaxID=91352 RepID=A0A9W5AUL4_CAMHY|nr:GTP cyclohydrolase I FolE [Campylobacter hyointestinalis]PPB58142.1 GTP cyclohydrolase I FolE [Campylobacter hyointestinalis subsp. hyointestinalis]PPB66776.1 GTP cyclohydrolase I FolE [Campylobacter hyointestinalis subsp. hyointestinalis]PPB70822.1 GTP cyclohydrolase I FolE [Campylobacter hyointestinalis subsp. hyointestinalis]RAZ37707.1 GTP cyclohydrolase I FolE [Campylobacter hyointestinalis subsp. lawsonii]CUU71934.1 GTP cyclohydrolase I [Campylobacter hyointestinalis subsp. hyointestin
MFDQNRRAEFEKCIRTMLEIMGENPDREGLLDTPKRVAKAYEFITSGYSLNPKDVLNDALFDSSNNEMVLIKDIEFYSLCEHHLLPIIGRAHVAYIPNGKVVGLSKIPRMVNIYARRLQIQEQMTEQIAIALQEAINPKGVGVVVEARHMCVEMRGVQKINSITTTSALRGIFIKSAETRKEFFDLINSPKSVKF